MASESMEMEDQPGTNTSAQQEPEPKRLKLSSTSDENGSARKQKYKRRKIAIFFGYCGVGYQGMQKNPGAKTIEGELEEALFHAGAVPDHDRGRPNRYEWSRSARTDKGVSAVGQVVSGRFYLDPPGLVHRLNSILPAQIRIFCHKRVTPSFSSKKFCDRRRYVYLIPVFALDPDSHRDMGSDLVECYECFDRGRKVVGDMGNSSFDVKAPLLDSKDCSQAESNNGDALLNAETCNGYDRNGESVKDLKVDSENVRCESLDVSGASLQNEGNELNCQSLDSSVVAAEDVKGSELCYGEKEKERFNRILSSYVGSHNFHNFTTRTKAEDPAARRYIISFDASSTVTVDGIDFVKCEVVGQSFMLHQIRKMMGLAVAVMRNCAPESVMEIALQKDVNINVPTAPEVGLYLDECLFSSYNKKWKDSHEELCMNDYAEEVEDFKMKHIYTHIAATERQEGVVGLWLHSLNHINYSDISFVKGNGAINNSENAEVENITKNGEVDQLGKIAEDEKSDEIEKSIE